MASLNIQNKVTTVVALSLLASVLGECSTVHSPCAFFFFFFWSGYKLEHTNSTLFVRISPQWLSELRRLWPSVPWQVACELVSWLVPTPCLDSGIVSPLRLRWVKDVWVFRFNLPPALLAEWPGSFACHCGNTGMELTPKEKEILPPPLPGFELATFRSRVRRSTYKLSRGAGILAFAPRDNDNKNSPL